MGLDHTYLSWVLTTHILPHGYRHEHALLVKSSIHVRLESLLDKQLLNAWRETLPYCGWTKSCTTYFETRGNHCLLVLAGESSLGFLNGGAKWSSSIHSRFRDIKPVDLALAQFARSSAPFPFRPWLRRVVEIIHVNEADSGERRRRSWSAFV